MVFIPPKRVPPGGFLLPLFLTALLLSCREKAPVIESINPRIGALGEVLSIRGKNFGAERRESYVTIAGTAPTNSSYLSWQDNLITLRVPEFGDSGLVYVHAGRKKSNGALFSNAAVIPKPAPGPETSFAPRIVSVEPPAGAVGSLISIKGSGFGSSRERGGVFFSWDADSAPGIPAEAAAPESVEVSEAEFGYDLWSEREIRVRVPDGAISGNLEVRTLRGAARPVFFEVSGKPGTKTFRDKRTYIISYSVDIQVKEAANPNALYLWVPQPVSSAAQRKIELLSRNHEPFVENHRSTTLFQFNNLSPRNAMNVNLSYLVEVYALETSLKVQAIKEGGDSPAKSVYTQPSPLIPSDDPRIKAQAAALVGRERNPYIKARRIYEWLMAEGNIRTEPVNGGAIEALKEKKADPYTAALLFCALARAAGVPSLPAAGVLVNRNRQALRHYWAEFWIDDFGWIPLDPALGAGAAPDSFNLRPDAAAYYFGNLDNQRLTFSRGQTVLSQMDPRGRAAVFPRNYALQNLWEEATGGLESYSSLWGDVTITGMYIQ
ncbi:MAG: IPT/TIG domain-containing protein [Spirochaetaceae bacterium]|jgi:transglutaminase-like putative cysteine protease|nr:IPT/TIG domain-containing protein [Spirochaetaceae bacterium]